MMVDLRGWVLTGISLRISAAIFDTGVTSITKHWQGHDAMVLCRMPG